MWGILGFLAFRSGVKDANARLDPEARAVLAPQEGSLLSNPTNVLLLGADVGSKSRAGSGNGRSDSIMLIHTDPDEHRLALLSIPRDLRVTIPGRGEDKVNSAYSNGGPALAIKTITNLTGLPVNHVMIVDFKSVRRGGRRSRRRHDQREEADPLEVRVPPTRRSAAPPGRATDFARASRR